MSVLNGPRWDWSPFLREKFRVQLEPPRMLAIASNLPRITQPWPLMKLLQSLALPKFQTAACNVDAHANIPAQFLTVLCTQLCDRLHMYLSLTLTVKLPRNQPVHWQTTICLFWNLCWDQPTNRPIQIPTSRWLVAKPWKWIKQQKLGQNRQM